MASILADDEVAQTELGIDFHDAPNVGSPPTATSGFGQNPVSS